MVRDERIKAAFYRIAQLEALKFDSYPDVSFVPSEEFEAKIKVLVEKSQRKEKSYLRVNRRKIIIALTAVILIASLLVACRYATQIKEFFVRVFDRYTSLTVEGDKAELIERYKLQFVPDGYCLVSEYDNSYFAKQVYEKGNDIISISQGTISSAAITIDTEENEYTNCYIGNKKIYQAERSGYYIFTWIFDDSVFSMSCPTSVSWADIEKMILSLEPWE